MKKIIINENSLHKIILYETYRGVLYHYTTLPLLYNILKCNCLYANKSDTFWDYRNGTYDPKTGDVYGSISFTRDKNYIIRSGYGVNCRLVFDAEKIMNIRYAKLYPVNFSGQAKIDNSNEAEERLWGVDINPLDKYVERVDILISNLSVFGDGNSDVEDELYDKYYDVFFEKYPHASSHDFYIFMGKKIIDSIKRLKKFKNKINIVNIS